MSQTDRLRIAVFIDFDNIEIGVKNTLGSSFDAGLVLEALKERGEVVSKMAYSDWGRAGGYSRMLTQHAIRMVQRDLTPGGDKNGADINLALDALEMAFTHPHINAFVIVGGDSDFISLVEKLKQYDKKIFIVGGRQFTSGILQRNCHEFIAYENLGAASAPPASGGGFRRPQGRDARGERAPIEQSLPLVMRAMKVLSEREVSPQIGLLKSTLLQLDSTFSERSYGAGSFRDFVEKLARLGMLRVYQAKGAWLVGPIDSAPPVAEAAHGEEGDAAPIPATQAAVQGDTDANQPQMLAQRPAPAVIGTPADGVRELARILASTQVRRWPMYLRNVKQLLRQGNVSFDERAYGFGNLGDLLRAAHKEGLVRVDRDRQGVIRVFQGSAPLPVVDPPMPQTSTDTDIDADAEIDGNRQPAFAPVEVVEQIDELLNGNVIPPPEEEIDDNIGNSVHAPHAAAAPKARRRRPTPAPAHRAPRAPGRRPKRS